MTAAPNAPPLAPFGPALWLSDGPTVTGAAGFTFPTRMAVIRLPDDHGLWVWSPVALRHDLKSAVDALGPVRHLIAPNTLHHSFLRDWAEAYPGAKVYAAPGLTEPVAGAPIHAVLDDAQRPEWAGAVEQVVVHGNRITTEAVFFHHASQTVLVTDLIQQIPQDWYKGWRAIVARLDLMTAAVPSVPRKFRVATRDKPAARAAVTRVLDWPAERLVIAHGPPMASGAAAALRRAFQWLLR